MHLTISDMELIFPKTNMRQFNDLKMSQISGMNLEEILWPLKK